MAASLQLAGAQAIVGGANINVSNLPNTLQSEMSLDINPTNPLNIAGFSHRILNPPPNPPAPVAPDIDLFFSTNGGLTWTTNTINNADDNQGDNGDRFDPSIAFDANGNLFIAYGVRLPGSAQTRLMVARSQDGGATFNQFTVVDTRNDVGVPGVDKWHLATGREPATGNQAVYVTYTQNVAEPGVDQRIVIAGSNNGGANFTLPLIVNDASLAGTDVGNLFADPAVGPNGELYVSWHDINAGTILFDRDVDGLWAGANSFGADVTVRTLVQSLFGTPVPAQPQRGIHAGPVLDVDRSGGAFNGRLYITFVDDPSPTNNNNYDIYLVRSDNQGTTWSNAGTSAGNVEPATSTDFLPWVDVDQHSGSVNVVYYTTDGDASGEDDVNARLATSIDGGVTFVRANLSTTTSNGTGPDPNDYGEYIGLAVHDGTAHGLWADNSGPNTDLEAVTASASFDSGSNNNTLVITGDDSGETNDVITLRRSTVNNAYLEVIVNGQRQYAGLFATLDRITVDGNAGNDTLTLDPSLGAVVPAGGLTFEGDTGTDVIVVRPT